VVFGFRPALLRSTGTGKALHGRVWKGVVLASTTGHSWYRSQGADAAQNVFKIVLSANNHPTSPDSGFLFRIKGRKKGSQVQVLERLQTRQIQ
jgi:hypothetical protein